MIARGSLRPGARNGTPEAWHDTPPEDARPVARAERYQTAIGIDLSYSGRGDSAAVVVVSRECSADPWRDRYYVRDAWSGARELRSLRATLAAYQARYPEAVLCSYVSGPERSVLALLSEESRDADGHSIPPISVVPMLAIDSKAARAAGTIELWNQGRVILPRKAWAESLARRVAAFDGSPSGSDDEVDALVSAVAFLRMAGGAVGGDKMTARRTSY